MDDVIQNVLILICLAVAIWNMYILTRHTKILRWFARHVNVVQNSKEQEPPEDLKTLVK